MAKVKPSLIEQTGAVGDRVIYTRFGKQFSRSRAKSFTDKRSEAQLRQRALFKAIQHTASILGSAIQRGLAKVAHDHGRVENNEFASINKECFAYEEGKVRIDYPRLRIAEGLVTKVDFTRCSVDGLHVELEFDPGSNVTHAHPDDVVFVYAVEFEEEVCQLVACVERRTGIAAFDLPDIREEAGKPVDYHLYAIVEAANTACISTLSPDEKKADKGHRNVDRRVSPSVYIGAVKV